MRRPVLECRSLFFGYQENEDWLLNDVSLTVDSGETLVLMGPSGCGKSSLAYCLADLYPEYAGRRQGEILCLGEDITKMTPDQRAGFLTLLFQNPDDQFCMDRVDREILFALENINYQGDLNVRMQELLALTGLSEYQRAPFTTLSGGQKQKAAIATALAVGARLLILDEPFANIDPAASAELAALLKNLVGEDLALLVIDHRLDYWKDFADGIILMGRHGQIAAERFAPDDLEAHWELFKQLGLFYPGESIYPSLSSPKPSASAVITARELRIGYRKKNILSDLSFSIPKGSIIALTGENGSGKTTLFWTLAGLLPHKGGLETGGSVGLVFQNPGYQFLTAKVLDEICCSIKAADPDQTPERTESRAREWLLEFGLLEYADTSPYMLSQGQQRRLAVLAMLASDKEILLLDEPTYAQDARATLFIMDLLRERTKKGLTTVLATHDHTLASHYADQIYQIEDGRLTRKEIV